MKIKIFLKKKTINSYLIKVHLKIALDVQKDIIYIFILHQLDITFIKKYTINILINKMLVHVYYGLVIVISNIHILVFSMRMLDNFLKKNCFILKNIRISVGILIIGFNTNWFMLNPNLVS